MQVTMTLGKGDSLRKMLPGVPGLGLVTLLLALVVLPASSATAAPILWTLVGVSFDDGATASGSFSTDELTGQLLSYDISTTAGVLPAEHYDGIDDLNYGNDYFEPNSFLVLSYASGTFFQYINLQFVNPLNTPGVNPLVAGSGFQGSWECDDCATVRYVTEGYATSDGAPAVPEPATLFLLGSGLIGFGLRRRRAL